MSTGKTRAERAVAVVAAAGSGARFGGAPDDIPKQFVDLAGETVLIRSLRTVLECEAVERIACPVPAEWRAHAERLVAAASLSVPVLLLEGGASRQESVARSLHALGTPEEPDLVVIHDAVRPLAAVELVRSALDAARAHGAAVVATPAVDTIATRSGPWLDTVLDRASLVNIQTPQAFRYGLIREAHRRAADDGITDASDDATLVLRLGARVAVVPGSSANIKITSPADFKFARVLLADMDR